MVGEYRYLSRRRSVAWLVLWLAFGAMLAVPAWNFSRQIKGTLTGVKNTESEAVREILVDNFSSSLAFPTAVVWDGAGYSPEENQAHWQEILTAIQNAPGVTDAQDVKGFLDQMPRDNWHVAFVELGATTYTEAEKLIPGLREKIHGDVKLPPDHQPNVTGGPALFMDLNTSSTEALHTAELKALPIAFIILLVVFRTLVAAVLPVLVAGMGVLVTLGGMSLLAHYWQVTFFVPNLITMIGLGVGIDYSLIFLARYRRERDMHLTTQESLRVACETAGHTVVTSAVMVMSGFVALLVIPLQFFHSIAVAGMAVVGFVAASTLTLLPSFIRLLGPYLEWGHVFGNQDGWHARARTCYHWWSRILLGRPWTCFSLGVVLLVLVAWPLRRLQVTSIQVNTLPTSAEARRGYDSMAKELGAGWLMPTILLAKHKDADWMLDEQAMAREAELAGKLQALDNTRLVVSVTDKAPPANVRKARWSVLMPKEAKTPQSLILLVSKTDPQSNASRLWLKRVQAVVDEQEKQYPNDTHYMVGGVAATTMAADGVIFTALPKVILITLCTTFLLLIYFMRALLISLKAILLNFLCVLAAYGFQVLWFQDGWGQGMGQFLQTSGLNTIVMVVLFCTLFGLSMDYEVFILCAVRESWLDQHHMKIAIEDGLQKTAGIITSAAVIMVSVFLCFAFGSVVETQQLGIGLSFAVLLDATVIRLILAPSAMAIMGKWCWWLPGRGHATLPAQTPNPNPDHAKSSHQTR